MFKGSENHTVQGFGHPVPATFGSEQVGSQSSKSNDHNVSAVVHLAAGTDNNTSTATAVTNLAAVAVKITRENENPFQKSNQTLRSPTILKTSSMGDINSNFSSPTTNSTGESEKRTLLAQLKNLEEVVSKLSNEITLLKRENEDLKRNIQSSHENNKICSEYHTDEEELEKEIGSDRPWTLVTRNPRKTVTLHMEATEVEEVARESDWIMKKSNPRKKRKAESSPEYVEQAKQTSTSSNLSTQLNSENPIKERKKQPPPINIVNIKDYPTVKALITSITDQDFKLVALNNDVWKVNVPDSDTYRKLTMKLNAEKVQWNTYEDKHDRPIKVMARGLHPTCESNDIIAELQSKGLDIKDAVNIIKKERTVNDKGNNVLARRGLPLFMLTFGNGENIQKIHDIRSIQNMKVRIEAVRKKSLLIVQCKKCQGFNHTQRYCGRVAGCVKCAGNHLTSTCTLDRNSAAKCINCKGQHPANYRGCEVAKELQNIRDRARKSDLNRRNHVATNRQINQGSYNLRGKESYAQVTQGHEAKTKDNNDGQILRDVSKCIEALNKKLDEQSEINKLIFDQLKTLTSSLIKATIK